MVKPKDVKRMGPEELLDYANEKYLEWMRATNNSSGLARCTPPQSELLFRLEVFEAMKLHFPEVARTIMEEKEKK
jgi:hypothetical protein